MSSAFQLRLARTAEAQYMKYCYLRENRSPLREQVQKYWRDLRFNFPGVRTRWSAMFVSWCAYQAGPRLRRDTQQVRISFGGNEDNAIGLKEVRLNRKGVVQDAQGLYMSVVETLL